MKYAYIFFVFLLMCTTACEGDFKGLVETDTANWDLLSEDTSSVRQLNADRDLPEECSTGDIMCEQNSLMMCLLGSWVAVMNCDDDNAACSVASGTAMCIKNSSDGTDKDSDTTVSDTESIVQTTCDTDDAACFNDAGYPCLPGNTANAQFDCYTWAVTYGPCETEATQCENDLSCNSLSLCIETIRLTQYSESLVAICFQNAGVDAIEKYTSVVGCVFCDACDISCGDYGSIQYCEEYFSF